MNEPEQEEPPEHLVRFFTDLHKATITIQDEIGASLLKDEQNKEFLLFHMEKSEEHMQEVLNRAAYVFLGSMGLASMNNVNMFTYVMALHSNITGDPLMHNVIEEVNRRTLSEE